MNSFLKSTPCMTASRRSLPLTSTSSVPAPLTKLGSANLLTAAFSKLTFLTDSLTLTLTSETIPSPNLLTPILSQTFFCPPETPMPSWKNFSEI